MNQPNPVGPAFAQAEASRTCHQVELRRPGVEKQGRIEPRSRLGQSHALAIQALIDRVVAGQVERHHAGLDAGDADMLAIGEARRVGHKRLDQERTARGEALGDTPKTAELRVLGREPIERIYDAENQRNSPWTETSARSPMVTAMTSPPGLARSPATMASDASLPWISMPSAGGFIGKARLEGGAGHRAVVLPAAGHDRTSSEHSADGNRKLNMSSNRVQRDKPFTDIRTTHDFSSRGGL